MIQSLNPATGKLLRSFDPLTPDALNAKIALAASAAWTYPNEPLDQRIFWMRRLAALLDSDLEELAALMTAEMGKTLASARSEVRKCAAACRYYADNAAHILAPESIPTEHAGSLERADCHIRYQPIGVVLAVMPWNFPLWQVFRFAAPALVAGNVGLLKHASNVPQCALAIEALIRRAGFPRGVFQTLLVETHQVETILADDRIAAVTVTGSEAAGRAIAAQAGWLIKKSVLELGGSDPFIVMASADLDTAVTAAVMSRCLNNGQSCIAAKRFLVHEDLYTQFEHRFTEAMAALRVGDPMLESTQIGPLATHRIVEKLLSQVAAARAAGGRILTGGGRASLNGNYFQPTVIAGVQRSAAICKQEIFGPVALLFRIGSLEEAIALANDTPFGLAASVWTADPLEQQRLTAELQCGAVFFNQLVASDPRLPFGGIKRSGYGRELSAAGMREFLNAKTVVIAAPSRAAAQTAPVEPPVEQAKPQPATEFSQIADQLRKFEPRKPASLQTEVPKNAPRSIPGGLPPVVFGSVPDRPRLAPIVWDSPPEPRKLAPIVLDSGSDFAPIAAEPGRQESEPSRSTADAPRTVPGGLPPVVFHSQPDRPRLAPIVWDSPPDPRKLAPIILDSNPDPRKLPPLIYGTPSDDNEDDKPAVRGSIFGL